MLACIKVESLTDFLEMAIVVSKIDSRPKVSPSYDEFFEPPVINH